MKARNSTEQVNNEIHNSATVTSAFSKFSSASLCYLLYFAILGKHKVIETLSSDAMEDL